MLDTKHKVKALHCPSNLGTALTSYQHHVEEAHYIIFHSPNQLWTRGLHASPLLVKSKTLLCLQLVTVDADLSTCKYSYMTRACHTIINHVEMLSSCTHRKPYFLSLQSTVQVCYQLEQAMATKSCSLSGHRVHPCRHETLILQYKKSWYIMNKICTSV